MEYVLFLKRPKYTDLANQLYDLLDAGSFPSPHVESILVSELARPLHLQLIRLVTIVNLADGRQMEV